MFQYLKQLGADAAVCVFIQVPGISTVGAILSFEPAWRLGLQRAAARRLEWLDMFEQQSGGHRDVVSREAATMRDDGFTYY
jgi:hypothetical protein